MGVDVNALVQLERVHIGQVVPHIMVLLKKHSGLQDFLLEVNALRRGLIISLESALRR